MHVRSRKGQHRVISLMIASRIRSCKGVIHRVVVATLTIDVFAAEQALQCEQLGDMAGAKERYVEAAGHSTVRVSVLHLIALLVVRSYRYPHRWIEAAGDYSAVEEHCDGEGSSFSSMTFA